MCILRIHVGNLYYYACVCIVYMTHVLYTSVCAPLQLLSLITAASAEIHSWDELITSCGRNHFLSAMYLMQQALLAKELGSDTSELSGLLSQALNHLKAYVKPSLEGASNEVGVLEGVCPPPPTLAWLSDDRMVFTPPDHFVPASGEKVCFSCVLVCVHTVSVCVCKSVLSSCIACDGCRCAGTHCLGDRPAGATSKSG